MLIERRSVIRGMAALPLAAVLADPLVRRAVAQSLESVSVTTASGKTVRGALAVPQTVPAAAVLLIHEWWGLNDQIKAMASELAGKGFMALAVDLFGGSVATTPEQAKAQTQAVEPEAATETLVAWVDWLKRHEKGTGKVATLGWCFGGGWSLNASIATPVDATVIYYGRVDRPAGALKSLQGPVLGHFGTEDQSINATMVGGFEAEMAKAERPLTVHWYTANHAFANPTGARYDADDAALAWARTVAFLERNLKG